MRRLLSPIAWGTAFVLAVLVPFAILAIFDPAPASHRATRYIPIVDTLRDGSMVVMLAALIVAIAVVVRRVVPQWEGLGKPTQAVYLFLVLLAQLTIILGGEVGMVMAGGGLHLFEGSWEVSSRGPDGRSAHVYTSGGLLSRCGHDVYIAEPWSLTMTKTNNVPRPCTDSAPVVRWNADGSVTLTNAKGEALPPEPGKPLSFSFWHGC